MFLESGDPSMSDQALGRFLSAAGLGGPLVLGVTEPDSRQVSWRVFDQPYLIVGRHPDCDLVLKDPLLSRRHVYLQAIAGRIFCVDLKSRTGTRWGGEAGLWGWVRPESGIEIGPFRLTHKADTSGKSMSERDDLPLPVSRSFARPAFAEVSLTIRDGMNESPPWQLSRSIVLVGRSPACRLRLDGSGIANIHASLVQTPAGLFAVDLLSPTGIVVDGRRTRCGLLGEDSELAIGPYQIRARYTSQWDQASHAPAGEPSSNSTLDRFARSAGVGPVGPRPQPLSGTKADRDTAILRSLVQELGQVQNEAAVRSLESLLAALRAFSEAHDEQFHAVREELWRIRAMIQGPVQLQRRPPPPTADRPAPMLRLVDGTPRPTEHRPVVRGPSRADLATGPDLAQITLEGGSPNRIPRSDAAGIELHDQILDRLAVIEGEHQSQWQRLVRSLFG